MPEDNQQIQDLATRHQLSESSVRQLLQGLLSTSGQQVQFNIPELGGMGQWMPGMIMAGNLFNHQLKARVDAVCTDIANLIHSGNLTPSTAPLNSNVTRMPPQKWWPDHLGSPSTAGAQNNMRYAWFPAARRLAVDLGGKIWVYDTGDHQISGVAQQQSPTGTSLTFTSQHGQMNLTTLELVRSD